MPFTPPEQNALNESIRALDQTYSVLLGRFKINSIGSVSALETLIARVNEHILKCKTDRVTALDVFTKLIDEEIRPILHNGTAEEKEQATLYLLGALLHRYFRIIKSYQSTQFGFFYAALSDIKSCRLFVAIRSALQLPGDDHLKDLNTLDVTTIVTALEYFETNMKANNHYKTFPHFLQDVNFIQYLDDIVDEHKAKAKDVLKQFKAIAFLQSLMKQLVADQQEFSAEVKRLILSLKEQHKSNWSEMLTQNVITYLQTNCAETLKKKMVDILNEIMRSPSSSQIPVDSLAQNMIEYHAAFNSYYLSGACTLLLESDIDDRLKHCICQDVLRVQRKSFSDDERLETLVCLGRYIESNPNIDTLNTSFFGDFEKFRSSIKQKNYDVDTRLTQTAAAPTL